MSTGQGHLWGESPQVNELQDIRIPAGHDTLEQCPPGALFAHLLNVEAKSDDLRGDPSTATNL